MKIDLATNIKYIYKQMLNKGISWVYFREKNCSGLEGDVRYHYGIFDHNKVMMLDSLQLSYN